MVKYKGIIFDLDGTLLNTIDDLADSMNEALRKLGYPIYDVDNYKIKVGGGFRGLAVNSLPKGTDEYTINKTVELFSEIYDKRYLNKSKPYDGIDKLLDELVSRGIALAVNSNKKDDYTKNLVHEIFARIPFINVYGEREGLPRKPDPYSALEILSNMGLSKEEVIYIGDSETDIQTANNVGMNSVGVLWGFRDRDKLDKCGATYIVEKPEDILELL